MNRELLPRPLLKYWPSSVCQKSVRKNKNKAAKTHAKKKALKKQRRKDR